MTVKIETIKSHRDKRGFVFEPILEELIASQRNMHVVVSNPGAVRGNHYHLKGTEIIAVTGSARVRIKEDGEMREITVPENEVYAFTFPPGVSHAILNAGTEPHILAAFNTVPHDPDHPDTVEDRLI